MTDFRLGLEILSGESIENLYWLPALVFGYSFHLSGESLDLVLAALGLVSARFLHQLLEYLRARTEENVSPMGRAQLKQYLADVSPPNGIFYGVLCVAYLCILIASVGRLLTIFDHSDIILVALAVLYLSILGMLISNIITRTFKRDGIRI